MDSLYEIRSSIYNFLFIGIYMSVIIILIAKQIFKNRIEIELPLNIIRIALIIYSVISLILYISSLLLNYFDRPGYERFSGPYWLIYWSMLILNTVLPLTLLIKKLGNKKYYLLLVSILMNIGWIFERFVIHMTKIERDYFDKSSFSPTSIEILVLGKGLILGIIILLIGNLIKMKKNQKLTLE